MSANVIIPVYWSEDRFGLKVVDFELMAEEFADELSKLDEGFSVDCTIQIKERK